MSTVKHAIGKLQSNGYIVENIQDRNDIFIATKKGQHRFIKFFRNGGGSENIAVIDVCSPSNPDDIMTDYHGGSFADNITQAMRRASN